MKRERIDVLSYKLITLDDGQEVVAALPKGFDVEISITSVKQQAAKTAAQTITKEQYDLRLEPTKEAPEATSQPEELQTNVKQVATIEDIKQEQI